MRNSNIELLRIVTMLMIIAHHYVVNSGLYHLMSESSLNDNSLFLYLLGMWGKTGINCFIIITGYYMCQSQITVKKILKLIFEICFYNVIIYLLFVLTGIIEYDLKSCVISIIPIKNIGYGFTSAYILFYLFIPYLNALINNINKKQHIRLIVLCLFIYTIWYMTPFDVKYNYISWFIVMYIIASFIRIYPYKIYQSFIFWKYMLFVSIFISCVSVIYNLHNNIYPYSLVSDSNSIMAVITSICAFMYFLNLKIRPNKLINTIAMSIFGVLLIHANSDIMRTWLWKDTLKNIQYFNSTFLWLHALTSIIVIFITCTLIDLLRIHFIENPFLKSKLFLTIESSIAKFLK